MILLNSIKKSVVEFEFNKARKNMSATQPVVAVGRHGGRLCTPTSLLFHLFLFQIF